ncbi:MAG: hypothetical protein O4751_16260 [Trichodesmium sp. St2_bin6]|nr:hypothetical protein [Trichodesmium sp. St2_bin6]
MNQIQFWKKILRSTQALREENQRKREDDSDLLEMYNAENLAFLDYLGV